VAVRYVSCEMRDVTLRWDSEICDVTVKCNSEMLLRNATGRCKMRLYDVRCDCRYRLWDVRCYCEVWRWYILLWYLKCDSDMQLWDVRCESEKMWQWDVTVRCDCEMRLSDSRTCDWGRRCVCEMSDVNLKRYDCEMWPWVVRCELEIWLRDVTVRLDVFLNFYSFSQLTEYYYICTMLFIFVNKRFWLINWLIDSDVSVSPDKAFSSFR